MKKMLDCAHYPYIILIILILSSLSLYYPHYPYIILIILILCKSLIFTNELIK